MVKLSRKNTVRWKNKENVGGSLLGRMGDCQLNDGVIGLNPEGRLPFPFDEFPGKR